MIVTDEDKVETTVRVQLSPTFWGWLFQLGKEKGILGTANVIEERQRRVAEGMEEDLRIP